MVIHMWHHNLWAEITSIFLEKSAFLGRSKGSLLCFSVLLMTVLFHQIWFFFQNVPTAPRLEPLVSYRRHCVLTISCQVTIVHGLDGWMDDMWTWMIWQCKSPLYSTLNLQMLLHCIIIFFVNVIIFVIIIVIIIINDTSPCHSVRCNHCRFTSWLFHYGCHHH